MIATNGLVLLLEADELSADALATLLGDWGYDCLHGSRIEELLPQAKSEILAIISDYSLSGAVVHAADRGVSVPALLLAGSLSGHAERAARAAGQSFIEKPARPERVKAWLDQLVVDVPGQASLA